MRLLYEYMHHYHSLASRDDVDPSPYPIPATDPNFPQLFAQASDMRHAYMEWTKLIIYSLSNRLY